MSSSPHTYQSSVADGVPPNRPRVTTPDAFAGAVSCCWIFVHCPAGTAVPEPSPEVMNDPLPSYQSTHGRRSLQPLGE